ncbi:MAG: CopG family antitoxin [bacterium]
MKENKKNDSVPNHFASLEEASDFWDTHDAGDSEKYLRPVNEEIEVGSELPQAVLPEPSLSEKIKKVAQQKGVSLETLVNLWLEERLPANK